MSVMVKIKQKALFKKKVSIQDIIALTGLSYGVSDENYRLVRNEVGENTLLYDENRLARGIQIFLKGADIGLVLSIPTSPSEVKSFYTVIEKICHHLNTETYIREGEKVSISEDPEFIAQDQEGSRAALRNIGEKIGQKPEGSLEIFGVCNPISIGAEEIRQINGNLENFEDYLHKLQAMDVYYAAPRFYQVRNQLIGVYAIGPDTASVVPTAPYHILEQTHRISDWYVLLKDSATIRYEDFMNHIASKQYYDSRHVIVSLAENEIDDLVEQYSVQI